MLEMNSKSNQKPPSLAPGGTTVSMDVTPTHGHNLLPPSSSASGTIDNAAIVTSTPVGNQRTQSHRDSFVQDHDGADMSSLHRITVEENDDSVIIESDPVSELSLAETPEDTISPEYVSVPIRGYEVIEERARFTVFQVQVKLGYEDTWFIFRRYSDFDQLNAKLKQLFPHFRLALPPKKWFGDNFDKNFLEDRMIGLQAFLNNIVGHKDVLNSVPVREFFCFEEPPGPHDSLEESRALCENLEEQIFFLHQEISLKDAQIEQLEDDLKYQKLQVNNLRKALK